MKKYFLAVVTLFTITLATNCKKDEEKKEEPPLKPTPVEEYQVSKDGTTLTKWVGSQTATVVDLTQNEALKQITKVGEDAFKGQQNITEITLPSTVKSIGKRAFYGCKDLKNITFAKKANATGRTPLMSRDSTVVEIPTTIEEVGEEAFAQCTSLYAITLPEGLQTIAKGLFKGCFSLTTVNYPSTVHTIEDEAFYGCENLLKPEYVFNVKTIGNRAFYGCSKIKAADSFQIENSQVWQTPMFTIYAETIGEEAFANCTALNVVSLRAAKELGKGVFKGCTSLSLIDISHAITSIPDEAFSGCTNLYNSPISGQNKNLVSIGKKAFSGAKFSEIIIPSNITSIGEGAFDDCELLTSFELQSTTPPKIDAIKGIFSNYSGDIFVPAGTVDAYKRAEGWRNYAHLIKTIGSSNGGNNNTNPDGVTIENGVLIKWDCNKIPADGKVVIPKSVTKIGDSAFWECTSLVQVIVPEGVTSIGHSSFKGCTSLVTIVLPNSVTTVGRSAFEYCKIDGLTLHKNTTVVGSRAFANTKITSLTFLKEGITTVNDSLFFNAKFTKGGTHTITLPTGVTTIGASAFENCNVTNVPIPNGVTVIGKRAFANSEVAIVTLPEGLTDINSSVFENCKHLKTVSIGDKISSIAGNVFKGCTELRAVTIATTNPPIIRGEGLFSTASKLTDIFVPAGTVDAYKRAEGWRNYAHLIKTIGSSNGGNNNTNPDGVTIENGVLIKWDCNKIPADGKVVIPKSVTKIGDSAFWECTSLVQVIVPEGVTSIGHSSFKGCTSLVTIVLPNSVKQFGIRTFYECTSLKNINIPNGITTIYRSTFGKCSSLETISLPNSVAKIEMDAFAGCTALKTINLPNNVTFDANCFNGCKSLVSIKLPNGIKEIPGGAFFNSGLKSIEIPNSVTDLGGSCFAYCKSLTSIKIPNTITKINTWTFNECVSLKTVEIPNSVTVLDDYCFRKTYLLTSIKIPNSVTKILRAAFYESGLISVNIPSSVTEIGDSAFENCKNLTSITFSSVTPPAIGRNIFDNNTTIDIYVPASAVETYKNNSSWKQYAKFIKAIGTTNNDDNESNYTSVPQGVIIENGVLVKWPEVLIPNDGHVKVPYGVKTIGKGLVPAFLATAMENFNPSQGGAPIGNGTLLKVTLPKTVTRIEAMGFAHCYRMHTLIMSDIEEIGTNAFAACMALKKIVIPSWIKVLKALPQPDYVEGNIIIVCKSATPIPVRNLDSTMIRSEHKLLVPKGSKRAYQQADFWKDFPVIEEEK